MDIHSQVNVRSPVQKGITRDIAETQYFISLLNAQIENAQAKPIELSWI